MSGTKTSWSAEALELAQDILDASDIGYWSTAYWKSGNVLSVREYDESQVYLVTSADLLDWLAAGDGPRALIAQIGDEYQKHAIAMLMAQEWGEVDYDVETGDLLVQQLVLGEVRYG